MSKKTLVFGSIVALLSVPLEIFSARAGTDGTPEAERSRLEDELAAARNSLDSLVLKPGMKLDDPRVREKAKLVEEKTKAYRESFQEAQKGPPKQTAYPNVSPDLPNGEKDEPNDRPLVPAIVVQPANTIAAPIATEAPSAPETVLSGDGVAKEITYSKKSKLGNPSKPPPALPVRQESVSKSVEEPIPAASSAPNEAGLSEIQYPKKKKP